MVSVFMSRPTDVSSDNAEGAGEDQERFCEGPEEGWGVLRPGVWLAVR